MSHRSNIYNKLDPPKPMDELSAQTPINQNISHCHDSNDSGTVKQIRGLGLKQSQDHGSIVSFKNSSY